MPFLAFLLVLVVAFIWDVILTGFTMLVADAADIPWLMDLSFWQVFGLLIVVSLATLKMDFSSK